MKAVDLHSRPPGRINELGRWILFEARVPDGLRI